MKTYQIIDHLPEACLIICEDFIAELWQCKAGHGEIRYQHAYAGRVAHGVLTDTIIDFLKVSHHPSTGVYLPTLKDKAMEIHQAMVESGRWAGEEPMQKCQGCGHVLPESYFDVPDKCYLCDNLPIETF